MSLRLAMAAVLVAGAGLAALDIAERPDLDRQQPASQTPSAMATADAGKIVHPSVQAAASPKPTAPEGALAPSGIIASIALEAFLAHDYPSFWHHKAVAVGPDGVFAASFREPDPDAAIAAAHAKCAEKLRWHGDPRLRTAACTTVAVDDVLSLKVDPDAAAATRDVTLSVTPPEGGTPAAWTLLQITSCDEQVARPWRKSWHDFFAASHVPRAELALTAPPDATNPCPDAGAAYDRFLRWNRVRLETALKRLTTAPDATPRRIVIWADGRAADVVHASAAALPAHVITTNAPCTLSLSRHSLLPAKVRVSAFVTHGDATLERAARRLAQPGIEAACAEAAKHRASLDVVALAGKPRFPLWRSEVMAKLARITGLPPIELKPDSPERLDFLPFEAHLFFTKTFTLHATHRAMVISNRGRFFVAAGHKRSHDAVQEALYRCRASSGSNGFIASEATPCILFAINDTVVFRES